MGMPAQQAAPTLASAYAQAQAMAGMAAMQQPMQPMQEMPPVRAMLPSAQGIPGQPPIPGPVPGQAAYVSMQNAPSADGPLGETAAGRPIDPAVLGRRPPSNRIVPILVGLMALLLLGGAAAAWVVMGKRARDEQALAASSTGSTGTAPTDSAEGTGSAAPSAAPADTGSAAPSAAPADTGSAAPSAEPSAAPSASASADANAGPADQTASVVCDPADCDEIKIDDTAIDMTKPFVVPPGKHTIVVSKAGYVTIKEKVTLKAGEKLDKNYKLTPKGTAGPGPSKPCGKFLKRCK
jgi:eukaryotic-like serine/threonine-protein kinase